VAGARALIPAGVSSQMVFMITKESHSIAIKSIRHEQGLRDHGDAVEVVCGLNPKFPDLIPPVAWPGQYGTLDIQPDK
jgi:hypothetical protein